MKASKKLLLLGGSAQQVIAIQTAKRLGYQTVLCDYLPDNPGQFAADQFYLVSTTDKEAILEVAQREQVDGVLAYASDPAAPTAAFVAEKMNLFGNPSTAVETLCNKDLFRTFLKENGFHAPESQGYFSPDDAEKDIDRFSFPVIIKPVDSSGSKGVTVLHDSDKLSEALDYAFSFSRSRHIIIEEFVEKDHPYLVGGDIFIVDGEVKLWGLLNCHRDSEVNPLVPVGKSYPLILSASYETEIRRTLQDLVHKLGIRSGAMNVELVVDKKQRVWPIDIGPRNGGNMIPDLLEYIFGVDIVELTVRTAIGENILLSSCEGIPYYATHNLHSNRSGILEKIIFSSKLEEFIIRKSIYKEDGDPVEFFDNAAKALGIIFLKFPDQKTMDKILGDINSYITIQLKREQR